MNEVVKCLSKLKGEGKTVQGGAQLLGVSAAACWHSTGFCLVLPTLLSCTVTLLRSGHALRALRSVFLVLEIRKRTDKCGLTVNTDAVFSVIFKGHISGSVLQKWTSELKKGIFIYMSSTMLGLIGLCFKFNKYFNKV
jgi:hypothetical protein